MDLISRLPDLEDVFMTFYAGDTTTTADDAATPAGDAAAPAERESREATMLRNAFAKGLRDQARPLLMWVIGVAFYVALLISIYPSIRRSAGRSRATSTACRGGPGGVPRPRGDFSTPVGYVNTELLSWLAPIVLIAFAVAIAARSLAGEEESGTLSLLLANTVGRRRLVLQKFAAMLVVVGVARRRASGSRSGSPRPSRVRPSAPATSPRRCSGSRCWGSRSAA